MRARPPATRTLRSPPAAARRQLLTAAGAALCVASAGAFTPYTPSAGWTYVLEAAREQGWPACTSRFVASDPSDPKVSLHSSADAAAEFTLVDSNTHDGAFYLRLASGRYLSYAGPCDQLQVDTWPEAGVNQEFKFRKPDPTRSAPFEWSLTAVGRSGSCPGADTVTFSHSDCSDVALAMGSGGGGGVGNGGGGGGGNAAATFWLHARRGGTGYEKTPNTDGGCADPFAWYSSSHGSFQLACTGGNLALFSGGATASAAMHFAPAGVALGGTIPAWAGSGSRWAPETLPFSTTASGAAAGGGGGDGNGSGHGGAGAAASATAAVAAATHNVLFFSDAAPDKHRVGWAMSAANASQALAGSWDTYAAGPLDLGNDPAGEIDQHIFRDVAANGSRTYLLWKTDDNSVGSKTTRLWGQEVAVSPGSVKLLGARAELMSSSGLWWVRSFVAGGSLVEGPELIHREEDGYYYLFFAAGKYCQDSYSEGVARSKSLWGPYEKMPVPLLSTALTGNTAGGHKQVGPGHASFLSVEDASGDGTTKYFAVYHASPGENCDRHAFVEEMKFDAASGWPYIDFGSPTAAAVTTTPTATLTAAAAKNAADAPQDQLRGRKP